MSTMINFSIFNKFVEFYQKNYMPTPDGGFKTNLSRYYFGWGQLKQIMPDVKARTINTARPWTHRLLTRYYASIKPGDCLIVDHRIYAIDLVINLGENNVYQELKLIEEIKDESVTIH